MWFSRELGNLYRKASFSVTLNCSLWGQSGTFRVFLRTNLSHAAVVARSDAIRVDQNSAYAVRSLESQFVLPCLGEDIKPLAVDRPRCSGLRDRIRVYGQGE